MNKPESTFRVLRSARAICAYEAYTDRAGAHHPAKTYPAGTIFRCVRCKSGRYLLSPADSQDVFTVPSLAALEIK